jgi:hypothetical protein
MSKRYWPKEASQNIHKLVAKPGFKGTSTTFEWLSSGAHGIFLGRGYKVEFE